MRWLWHTVVRFLLVVSTLVPIYLGYLWLWTKLKWFGISSDEAWRRAHRRYAERFYRLAVRMRGALIKVGQIISVRVDIAPVEWTSTLSRLQDKVDPTPWSVIEKHLTEQLGGHPDDVFARIDHASVAAASFGQVHRATTKEGDDVALKIKYADIDMKLAADMVAMKVAVPLFNVFVPRVKLKTIYAEVRRALETELDYEQEADYSRRIHANLDGMPQVVTPMVLERYTTRSVICTTWFEGFKVTDTERIEREGASVHEVIQLILKAYTHQIFVDGVFQSDPHPGNVLCRIDHGTPTVCILDFGQVKVLPPAYQEKLVRSSLAFMVRDVDGFAKSLVDLGLLTEKDATTARPLLEAYFDKYMDLTPNQAKQLDFEEIKDGLAEVVGEIEGVTIPTDIVLYGRTFAMLAGLVTALDADVNGFVIAQPMILTALTQPDALKTWEIPASQATG